MESIVLYVKESWNELVHKVSWPSWPHLIASTRLVLVASVIISLVVFVLDSVSNTFLTSVYGILN